MAEPVNLSDAQAKALLDILSHHEVYQEILDFRLPSTLRNYGPPFDASPSSPSTSPSLQALVSRFFLTLPGLKDVSKDFWRQQLATIIEDFEKADLSESYDKGHLGIRKTLATAISALIEYPVRGVAAGFDRPDQDALSEQYDTTEAAELQQAFRDAMQQSVYGSLIDDVFATTAQTEKLSDHAPMIQAAHEYVLVNLASFMHYTLIKSPKGQQLLTLLDHTNKLVPYTIIRQTLKIGNVASMINAMMRVVLAKMSVASVTNWMGMTQSSDDGMNLMQNIIAQVLQWEIRDFKSRTTKIEKNKEGPSKEQLRALKEYTEKSRAEHDEIREMSVSQSKSIAIMILHASSTSPTMTPIAHTHALAYLSNHLSIRDRQEIIRILCHSHPDHLTTSVRELVAAYEPMIRHVHNAVDLSATVTDFEVFLRDMIRLAKLPDPLARSTKSQAVQQPTVGDFMQLLKKHQSSSHKFLHQVTKNDKELSRWFSDYARASAANFMQKDAPESAHRGPKGAGDLTAPLQELFSFLATEKQKRILPILDRYSAYLARLHAASAARLRDVLESVPSSHSPAIANSTNNTHPPTPAKSKPVSKDTSLASTPTQSAAPSRKNSLRRNDLFAGRNENGKLDGREIGDARKPPDPGPGAYLARWQSLLDATLITPVEAEGGKVRGGAAASVKVASSEVVKGGDDDDQNNSNDHNDALDDDDNDVFEEAQEQLDTLGLDDEEKGGKPDVTIVVEALGQGYREMLGQRCCAW